MMRQNGHTKIVKLIRFWDFGTLTWQTDAGAANKKDLECGTIFYVAPCCEAIVIVCLRASFTMQSVASSFVQLVCSTGLQSRSVAHQGR
jgi:hypothetical protein